MTGGHHPARLESPRLLLREPEPADAEVLVEFLLKNRDYLAPYEPVRPPEHFAVAYQTDRLARYGDEARHGRALRLFLFQKDLPETLAGFIAFNDIVRGAFHCCNLGYALDEDCQKQGLMTEALSAAIGHAFGPMNLHRLQANHLPDNHRSAAVLARLGFVREGLARDYLRIDGRWRDHILTSLTNPAWRDLP